MTEDINLPEEIVSNGIFAEDGEYGLALDQDSMYTIALEGMQQAVATKAELTLGLPPSLERYAARFDRVRWGIIIPEQPTPEEAHHLEILQPLVKHRQELMWGKSALSLSYKDGWTVDDFLWDEGERGISRGKMNPEIIPYYLTIVAPPDRISWEFQQELSQDYAVGRIWFDDPDDCQRYIERLLENEKGELNQAGREALFIGPQFPGDKATALSSNMLVKKAADWLDNNDEFEITVSLWEVGQEGHQPTKTNLIKRLSGKGLDDQAQTPPSLIFAGTHGLEFRNGSQGQHAMQGALLMQEWPGPKTKPEAGHFVSSQDIQQDFGLSGSMGFLFACYSAGMPLYQDWAPEVPVRLTDKPFVARLPQKLMANGMLALIGHVSKAWGYSFMGVREAKAEIDYFTEPIGELLRGAPVGHATSYLNEGVLHLIAMMRSELEQPGKYPRNLVNSTWLAYRDLKGYVVLGDPAVRISEPLTRD